MEIHVAVSLKSQRKEVAKVLASHALRIELLGQVFILPERKMEKSRCGSEKLTKCQTFEAGDRIMLAAKAKNNKRIFREMGGGLT